MKSICPKGPIIKGIDVSSYQVRIDWPLVKASGFDFCFIKASEAAYTEDTAFEENWKNSKEAGFIRGAYHYFHFTRDPHKQAQNFLNVVGELLFDDLPCVLDLELEAPEIPFEKKLTDVRLFLNEVESISGKRPLVYGSPYFLKEHIGTNTFMMSYPLWIAHYKTKCPVVPFPWIDWTFWQYTDEEEVPGIGLCDANFFNGTLDQLKDYCQIS